MSVSAQVGIDFDTLLNDEKPDGANGIKFGIHHISLSGTFDLLDQTEGLAFISGINISNVDVHFGLQVLMTNGTTTINAGSNDSATTPAPARNIFWIKNEEESTLSNFSGSFQAFVRTLEWHGEFDNNFTVDLEASRVPPG